MDKPTKQRNFTRPLKNTILVPLSKGYSAIIDKEDAKKVLQYKWTAREFVRKGKVVYVYGYRFDRTGEKPISVMLHRFITNAPKGMVVDHINGVTLDNRRTNLRICTDAENRRNMGRPAHNTSGYKGVTWDKRTERWVSQIAFKGEYYFLGRYDSPIEAARKYDSAARRLHGEFTQLNFPRYRGGSQ